MSSILDDFNAGVQSHLVNALGAGTAIYRNQAPDKEPYPYVVWNWQNFMDENLTPSKMFNNILNIRAYAANPTQADTIYGILDNSVDGHTITITGQSNFFTVRTMPFEDVFTDPSGIKTHVAGGLYRIRTGQ